MFPNYLWEREKGESYIASYSPHGQKYMKHWLFQFVSLIAVTKSCKDYISAVSEKCSKLVKTFCLLHVIWNSKEKGCSICHSQHFYHLLLFPWDTPLFRGYNSTVKLWAWDGIWHHKPTECLILIENTNKYVLMGQGNTSKQAIFIYGVNNASKIFLFIVFQWPSSEEHSSAWL